MTLEAILLKLLPFTYIDKHQEVHFSLWSDLNDGDIIITFVEVFLFSLFLIFIIRLIISWLKDRKQINLLVDLLEKYKNVYLIMLLFE